ncbi:fungal-specific transcription factor domain-containing protein [Chaetomium strumarium]|uniref:Fungal-specific transcription factor domain-containing protein n=1 Tax=Chaetomium strumarium TaxID=1170767 RepID=A0AAJ0M5I6_9PEZI|nr:fungal-specific transcription factor domain-containing protein [Chaetomium strumarium]
MATKIRSSGGCWTCRLRRKKCDEERPLCKGCLALEIDCLYSEEKPDWMDGGEKQKQRAEWLKKEVKRKAAHRRELRFLQGLEVRLESLDASLTDDSDTPAPKNLVNTVPVSARLSDSSTPRHGTLDTTPNSASHGATPPSDTSVSVPSPDDGRSGRLPSPSLDLRPTLSQEEEAHSAMMYLDYVFPFLFPYYRPSFADVGRGWLLVLLTKNKALFHSALSLAGYFYGIVLGHIQDAPRACHDHNAEVLHERQGLALQWLQLEMQDIITRGVKGNLREANRVMASIIQLMTCDVAIAKPGNWVMHLSAATELFNEIMKHHAATPHGTICFMAVLLQLGSRPFSWTPKSHPWGSDQATLRFFTAQLLFFDTLASTALQQPPRLQQWHQYLLTTLDDDEETRRHWPDSEKEQTLPHINLQEFLGVENWVIASIAEIATLDHWKKEMKRAGSLSFTQLLTRAAPIAQRLRTCLQALEETTRTGQGGPASVDGPQHLLQYFAGSFSPQLMHGVTLNTRIWAQAALTYLSLVLSGWQPSCPEIQHSVAKTIDMLQSLPSPDCLRTLVWPFTVTGCLASRCQEQIFRDMVDGMGPLKVFGTIREGFAIMCRVWENRAEIDEHPDQWDLAACLNCLSQPALLI